MVRRQAHTAAVFQSTRWSVVRTLQDAGEDTRLAVLGELCRLYWFPLYAFSRRRGLSAHDAEDAVQSFFADTGDACFFQKADAERGRLRTFILTAFTRHLGDLRDQARAAKRGGGVPLLSIDHDQVEEWLLADPKTGDESGTLDFERHWAKNLLRSAVASLEASVGTKAESRERFRILSRFLNPETCAGYTIREAAQDTGMTASACEKAVQRLRHGLRLAVREQVAATLEAPTEATILEEMRELQRALGSVDAPVG